MGIWSSFSRAATASFNTVATFAEAAEAVGNSAKNMATVLEEESGIYLDESRASRKEKQLLLQKKIADTKKLSAN